MSSQRTFEILSSSLFFLALIHTFLAGSFIKLSKKFKPGSVPENLFHLLGEVEIVFGLWSAILVILSILFIDFEFINSYLSSRNFTEALFVFVAMTICSSKPIVKFFEKILIGIGYLLPINSSLAIYFIILTVSPLLGSLITEPASITISAFLLLPRFYKADHSENFKYATIAVLFINTSIGGTLSHFAAPPVLMVASKWNWDLSFMLTHFAPSAITAVFINATIATFLFKKEIKKHPESIEKENTLKIPFWVSFTHLVFLALVVGLAHYPILFVGIFLFYLGFLKAAKEYQSMLILREPLLVGFFLAGLIVLGGPQKWWLEPILTSLDSIKMYLGAIGLTAFTDNAALTYLGSLVENLSDESKLLLVKGSVVGGGLTLIANAPNPAGLGILNNGFEGKNFSSAKLFFFSFPLTIITGLIFYFF